MDVSPTVLETMFMEMRKTLGVPIIERAVLHSHTAVIILDVYGDTTFGRGGGAASGVAFTRWC